MSRLVRSAQHTDRPDRGSCRQLASNRTPPRVRGLSQRDRVAMRRCRSFPPGRIGGRVGTSSKIGWPSAYLMMSARIDWASGDSATAVSGSRAITRSRPRLYLVPMRAAIPRAPPAGAQPSRPRLLDQAVLEESADTVISPSALRTCTGYPYLAVFLAASPRVGDATSRTRPRRCGRSHAGSADLLERLPMSDGRFSSENLIRASFTR